MGCNCGKSRLAGLSGPAVRRETVYQVMLGTNVVEEFSVLASARTKATEVGGRVKVTSKVT